ncbi:hypothetical protein OHA10_12525 [Kribbella sp. NBC_00662]|uniref:OadG family protein n=1 Tax=Kribbella sp. NBC_00662 TaxID=2975969 RepID=UPI00324995F3
MNGMTIVWIVVALAALVIVAGLVAGAVSKRSKRRAEARPPSAGRIESHEPRTSTEDPRNENPKAQNLWPETDWDDGTHPHDPRPSKHTKH